MERTKPVIPIPLPLGFLSAKIPTIRPATAMRSPKTGIQQNTRPQIPRMRAVIASGTLASAGGLLIDGLLVSRLLIYRLYRLLVNGLHGLDRLCLDRCNGNCLACSG